MLYRGLLLIKKKDICLYYFLFFKLTKYFSLKPLHCKSTFHVWHMQQNNYCISTGLQKVKSCCAHFVSWRSLVGRLSKVAVSRRRLLNIIANFVASMYQSGIQMKLGCWNQWHYQKVRSEGFLFCWLQRMLHEHTIFFVFVLVFQQTIFIFSFHFPHTKRQVYIRLL